jgi:hypothetical protein
LDGLQVVCFREIDDFELVLLFVLLDPFVSLALRVDEEWPASALGGDNAIINTQGVVGEAFDDPLTDGEWGLQCLAERIIFRVRNAQICEFLLPACNDGFAIGASERPQIGNRCSREEDVSYEFVKLLSDVLDLLFPSDALLLQQDCQFLSADQPIVSSNHILL